MASDFAVRGAINVVCIRIRGAMHLAESDICPR